MGSGSCCGAAGTTAGRTSTLEATVSIGTATAGTVMTTDCSAADHARTDTPVVKPDTELKGYKIAKQLDAADHHVRSTIVVIDGDKRVVGFIPHPEEVQGIVIGP